MTTLSITVVGQDIFKVVREKIELVGINQVNQINTGMLGNLKTLTYRFELDEMEVIKIRKELLRFMAEDNMRLMPMFLYGDWMKIFVFKPIRI